MAETIRESKLKRTFSAIGRGAVYIVMGVFALMTLYPIFWLIMNSFKTTREFQVSQLALPHAATLQNYSEAWKMGDFGLLFPNSIIYTLGATAGIIFLSLLAGFAFAKLKSKATKPIYNSFVIGILLTTQTLMIPLFLEVNLLGIYNTRLAVLLVYIGAGLPIGIYLSTEYIKAIPSAVVESARIDGAGFFQDLPQDHHTDERARGHDARDAEHHEYLERVRAHQYSCVQDRTQVAAAGHLQVFGFALHRLRQAVCGADHRDGAHACVLHDFPQADNEGRGGGRDQGIRSRA
jgi:ABC-type sugar transport system, permease component